MGTVQKALSAQEVLGSVQEVLEAAQEVLGAAQGALGAARWIALVALVLFVGNMNDWSLR